MADIAPRLEDIPDMEGEEESEAMCCMLDMLCMADIDMFGTLENMLLCCCPLLPNTVITFLKGALNPITLWSMYFA